MSEPTKLQQAILTDVAHELGNISPTTLWEWYCEKHEPKADGFWEVEEFENELWRIGKAKVEETKK